MEMEKLTSDKITLATRLAQDAAGHKELVEAAHHMMNRALGKAEPLCRTVLNRDPNDVNAMRMLADIGIEMGMFKDAEHLLARALSLAPDFDLARNSLSLLRSKQGRYEEALSELDILLKNQPANPVFLTAKANILVRIGNHASAITIFRSIIETGSNTAGISLSLGHSLKTIGKQADAVEAYRTCLDQKDDMGDAYWSLANLKTFEFSDDDIVKMRTVAGRDTIAREEYFHIAFALGKALEDQGEFDESFTWYRRGNAIKRRLVRYSAEANRSEQDMMKAFFTPKIFAARKGEGCEKPDPIFIIGLPRAGSTLLEQILASHSQVEGTQELPDIISIARRLNNKKHPEDEARYPKVLANLSNDEIAKLGEGYLEHTQIHRSGKPFFIDKMPNNFAHIGLISMILPNAKIIDARRHPMACCFSGYKQLFAKGQNFTYNMGDIGRYYADYVDLMAHWDAVLSGKVLRVHYENMVADTEAEVRRLLKYCGLPFEDACLKFYENKRAVKTASSEQVRQPIYTSGLEQWRNFVVHLEPLKAALGDCLNAYPHAHIG